MQIWQLLGKKYPNDSIIIKRRINIKDIPILVFDMTKFGADRVNEILESAEESNLSPLSFSKSGGISTEVKNFKPSIAIRVSGACLEIIILSLRCARIQFRNTPAEEKVFVSGRKAFGIFEDVCAKYGVNVFDFEIENGEEVKKTIPKPKISLETLPNVIFNNAHHIDIHSAYMGALAEEFPTFRKPIEEIYAKRKEKTEYKDVLTHTFGYMQSIMTNYRFSHLSKVMIEKTIYKLEKIAKRLRENGRQILAFNTDGIWYSGDLFEGGEGFGKGLGEWENNHKNCKIKFKSIGCYAYEENGVFHPVARGRYKLDKIKPRSEWTWEDFNRMDDTFEFKFCYDSKIGKYGRIISNEH